MLPSFEQRRMTAKTTFCTTLLSAALLFTRYTVFLAGKDGNDLKKSFYIDKLGGNNAL
jgi:hypothetical protein